MKLEVKARGHAKDRIINKMIFVVQGLSFWAKGQIYRSDGKIHIFFSSVLKIPFLPSPHIFRVLLSIYIYIYMCVCVCVYIYIYIYIYIYTRG